MSSIFLLRHAHSTANQKGILAGRTSGVSLSTKGQRQAEQLIPTLLSFHLDQIIHSPLERCAETIAPFRKTFRQVNGRAISSKSHSSLLEMNYGDWTGRSLKSLARLRSWSQIQQQPAQFTFPGGEGFTTAAARIVSFLDNLPDGNILVVTHGDIIRLALAHYLGMPLNSFQRIVIEPASVSHIFLPENGHSRIGFVNRTLDDFVGEIARSPQLGGETGNEKSIK